MKKRLTKISKYLFALILCGSAYNAQAQETDYDFSDDKSGTTIYYNVTVDEFPLEVAVAFGSYDYNSYSGVINIPVKVVKDGRMQLHRYGRTLLHTQRIWWRLHFLKIL